MSIIFFVCFKYSHALSFTYCLSSLELLCQTEKVETETIVIEIGKSKIFTLYFSQDKFSDSCPKLKVLELISVLIEQVSYYPLSFFHQP